MMNAQHAFLIEIAHRLVRFLERFRAKWIPVRVKKTRQNKNLEPGSDSIRTEKAQGGEQRDPAIPVVNQIH
jgi:hypothetical protein